MNNEEIKIKVRLDNADEIIEKLERIKKLLLEIKKLGIRVKTD